MSNILSVLLPAIGALTVLTNVITQVVKQATKGKISTNIVALVVALWLTVFSGDVYCMLRGVMITWYIVVGLVVLSFLVAYAAMFGYDKLKEVLKGWQNE